MNPQRPNGGGPGDNGQQNALSLLVDAAGSRDPSQHQSLADTLRLRGFSASEPSGAPSLEEQLLLQQQMYGLSGASNTSASSILSQLQERNNLLGALGAMGGNQSHHHHHHQQLASLLGLGGADNFRSALAAAHLRQQQQSQQQFTHADILALARSGQTSLASSLLSGFGGGGNGLGGGPGSGLGGGPGSGLGGVGSGLGTVSGMGRPGSGLGGPSGSGLGGPSGSGLGGSGLGGSGLGGSGLGGSGLGGSGLGGSGLGGSGLGGSGLGGSGLGGSGLGGSGLGGSGLGGSGFGGSGLGGAGNGIGGSGRGLGGAGAGLGGSGRGLGGPVLGGAGAGLGGSGRGLGGAATGGGPGNGLGGPATGMGGSGRTLGSGGSGLGGAPASSKGALVGTSGSNIGGPGIGGPVANSPGSGAVSGGAATGLASQLESLQRLEEIERRQRLIATGASPLLQGSAATASVVSRGDPPSTVVKGDLIRDERVTGGHVPRPSTESSQSEKKDNSTAEDDGGVPGLPGVSATLGTESGNKDELEKTPGSVIVPCRARGMPMDHNFKTAYFVIPENVKHGEELICSYFACRNAGIKFRYCSHCKVPVAKRNFRKRHKHGGEKVPPIHGDLDDSEGEEQVGGKRGIPSSITAKRSSIDADGLSSNSAESQDKEETPEVLVCSSIRNFEEKQEPQISAPAPPATLLPESNPKISNDRMERWASLLGRRPATKEGDMMSAWLMEVLAVSDLDTPLKAAEDLDSKEKPEKADPKVPAITAVAEKASATSGELKRTAKDTGASSVVKKKRPAETVQNDVAASTSSAAETFASGSFAAWKERKKQKKQAKMNPTQEAEV